MGIPADSIANPGPTYGVRRTYTIQDLREGEPQTVAATYPRAWLAFMHKMEGRDYGCNALTDAWLWFLAGWLMQ